MFAAEASLNTQVIHLDHPVLVPVLVHRTTRLHPLLASLNNQVIHLDHLVLVPECQSTQLRPRLASPNTQVIHTTSIQSPYHPANG